MKYKVKYLEIAKEDKEKIKQYLSQFYPNTPGKFIEKLKDCIKNLKEMPYMYSEYEHYPSYRRAIAGNYLVFYKVNEYEKTVEIHRILPGMWDIARYFENSNE